MDQNNYHIIFSLEKQLFALELSDVVKVVRSVQITPVPEAPPLVLGLIDLGGQMIPVLDIRQKMHLPAQQKNINQRILIISSMDNMICFFVDTITDVLLIDPADINLPSTIMPDMEPFLYGVSKYKEQTVLHYRTDFFAGYHLLDEHQQHLQLTA